MTTTTTPSKLAVIFAGEELPAIMLDGSSVQVRVRAMPARHLGKVLATCTDEAALLDLVCSVPSPVDDKEERLFAGWQPVPANWADNLNDEDPSYAKLLDTAKRLNFSRAAAWGERQIAAKQFQAPILLKADEALMPIVRNLASQILSQMPSASSASPTTKS